jgi:transcriptional regulator of NAD metabolism
MANTTLGTSVAMQIRPVNAAVSANNPKYTFNAVITEWQSVSGELGSLSTVSVSWPISGNITKSIT